MFTEYNIDVMTHDVAVVGAGPVGLFLAIELATAGVKPLVLERLLEPDRTLKAAAVGTVAAEALERRGLARALEDEHRATMALMAPALKARFGSGPVKQPGGHFSAIFLIDQSVQRGKMASGRRARQGREGATAPYLPVDHG